MSLKAIGRRLAMTAVLAASGEAAARTVLYTGKTETVPVYVGTPTIVRFERPVKTVTNAQAFVIRPASDESPDYTTLAIDARRAPSSALANFILADGQIVRTKLMGLAGSPGAAFDSVIDFKGGDQATGPALGDQGPEVKAIDLMKAAVRGDRVMGYEVRELKRALLGDKGDVRAELVRLYTGGELNAYVIHLTNKSKKKTYRIDIRNIRLGEPNLAVLSEIDRPLLDVSGSGKDETDLRVVARPGGVYKDMILPVAREKPAKGGGS